MKIFFLIFLVTALAVQVDSAFCDGAPDPNHPPNLNPIYEGPLTYVRSVKNGKLYKGGPNNEWYIAHIWGSPYELGLAHGQLLRDEIISFVTEMWTHIEDEFIDGPTWVPQSVREFVAEVGLDAALQLTAWATQPYTPEYWFQEFQGLAAGINSTKVSYSSLLYLSLLPEFTKATCSMFGAWGESIAKVQGTDLLQLRALDWDTDGPIPKFPAIIVYHPTQGHPFVNIGWTGWIGSISGASASQMAVSEIGAVDVDETWGEESRFGYPFPFLMRDILQFDSSVEDSINRIQESARTCHILLGVGDGKTPEFRGFKSSYSSFGVYGDTNLEPNAEWHPRIKDIVYWGMDWNCPGWDQPLSELLQRFYGNITAENTIRYILPTIQTGETHAAIYDLTRNFMYVSIVGPLDSDNRAAYDRQFTKFDLNKLFAELPPAM